MTNAVFTTDAMSIVLNYVFPSLGVMIGTSLFMAPLPALKACLQRGSLGDLNPLPWSFMTGNTLGWVTYSFLTKGEMLVNSCQNSFSFLNVSFSCRHFCIFGQRTCPYIVCVHEYGCHPITVLGGRQEYEATT